MFIFYKFERMVETFFYIYICQIICGFYVNVIYLILFIRPKFQFLIWTEREELSPNVNQSCFWRFYLESRRLSLCLCYVSQLTPFPSTLQIPPILNHLFSSFLFFFFFLWFETHLHFCSCFLNQKNPSDLGNNGIFKYFIGNFWFWDWNFYWTLDWILALHLL